MWQPVLALVLAALMASLVAAGVGIGSTREEVIEAYGKPYGSVTKKGTEVLFYDGGSIDIRDGQVVRIDSFFTERAEQREKERAFEAGQRARGLVKYRGEWMKPSKKEQLEREQKEEEAKRQAARDAVRIISNGGRRIGLGALLVPGKVTIVDFYADWCGPCRRISPQLEKLAREDPDVVLRQVDIVSWHSDVAKQYSLHSIPSIRVYDRTGRQVGQPTAGMQAVRRNVSRAK